MATVEEQLKKIDERLVRIERHMKWDFILSTVRLVIIGVPIVLALIYIPPFVKKYIPLAQQMSAQAQEAQNFLQNFNLSGVKH